MQILGQTPPTASSSNCLAAVMQSPHDVPSMATDALSWEFVMKHPIYRPIAIGALLALASLTARTVEHKDTPAQTDRAAVTKVSQTSHDAVLAPL